MNALQKYANRFIRDGWTIGSMTDQQFIATRRKGINGLVALFGVIGLFFYLIPGLLILLIGYAARGTETQIVTDAEAQVWSTQEEQRAEKRKTEEEARKAANEKKIAELSDSPLRFWYMMSNDQRLLLIVVVVIVFFALFMKLSG